MNPTAPTVDTSAAALSATSPRINKGHRDILALLKAQPNGFTADEAAGLLYYNTLFVRPRMTELHKMKLVEKTGERRKNKSGMSANVWRAAA